MSSTLVAAAQGTNDAAYLKDSSLADALRKLAADHGDACRLSTFGTSRQGRELWLLELGHGADRDRRTALAIVAGIDGDFPVGSAVALRPGPAVGATTCVATSERRSPPRSSEPATIVMPMTAIATPARAWSRLNRTVCAPRCRFSAFSSGVPGARREATPPWTGRSPRLLRRRLIPPFP
ncbi:MAG: hypothetical protein IIA33_04025 [Planctomycetes bacterium]|nr:hypothetical protein [Planctomycetota bacterium]